MVHPIRALVILIVSCVGQQRDGVAWGPLNAVSIWSSGGAVLSTQ